MEKGLIVQLPKPVTLLSLTMRNTQASDSCTLLGEARDRSFLSLFYFQTKKETRHRHLSGLKKGSITMEYIQYGKVSGRSSLFLTFLL